MIRSCCSPRREIRGTQIEICKETIGMSSAERWDMPCWAWWALQRLLKMHLHWKERKNHEESSSFIGIRIKTQYNVWKKKEKNNSSTLITPFPSHPHENRCLSFPVIGPTSAKSLALLWRQEGARGVEDQVQMEADASRLAAAEETKRRWNVW